MSRSSEKVALEQGDGKKGEALSRGLGEPRGGTEPSPVVGGGEQRPELGGVMGSQ